MCRENFAREKEKAFPPTARGEGRKSLRGTTRISRRKAGHSFCIDYGVLPGRTTKTSHPSCSEGKCRLPQPRRFQPVACALCRICVLGFGCLLHCISHFSQYSTSFRKMQVFSASCRCPLAKKPFSALGASKVICLQIAIAFGGIFCYTVTM